MEPLPEMRENLDRLSAALGDGMDLARYLDGVACVAEAVIPSCAGVSITILVDGTPFTMTSTNQQTAVLDAVQNVDGGPCLDALDTQGLLAVDDLLDEHRWHLFAQAAALHGVRSSLSFPIRDMDGVISGGMNIYSGDPNAFAENGRLIEIGFGADLSEAVTNADLEFATREFARELPQQLDALEDVDRAVVVLAQSRGLPSAEARERLARAARLAGRPVADVARVVLALDPERPTGR